MFVFDQDQELLVNIDNAKCVRVEPVGMSVEDCAIWVSVGDNTDIKIAEYDDEDAAQTALSRLARAIADNRALFEMPRNLEVKQGEDI